MEHGNPKPTYPRRGRRQGDGLQPISFSSLSLMAECPLCFWFRLNRGLSRPAKPLPGILQRLDKIQKELAREAMGGGPLPLPLLGKLPGSFVPKHTVPHNLSITLPELRFRLVTRLDAVIDLDGLVAPTDFKSFGDPKPEEYLRRYYQLQGELYNHALASAGHKVANRTVFVMWFPRRCPRNIQFEAEVATIPTPAAAAHSILTRAREVLDGPVPEPSPTCAWCAWAKAVTGASGGQGGPP